MFLIFPLGEHSSESRFNSLSFVSLTSARLLGPGNEFPGWTASWKHELNVSEGILYGIQHGKIVVTVCSLTLGCSDTKWMEMFLEISRCVFFCYSFVNVVFGSFLFNNLQSA